MFQKRKKKPNMWHVSLWSSQIVLQLFFFYRLCNCLLQIHLAPLYLDNEEPRLHIKFYDIPGIGEKNNVGREELDMMIDGQLKKDVEVQVQNKFKHQDISVCLFCNKIGKSLYSLN